MLITKIQSEKAILWYYLSWKKEERENLGPFLESQAHCAYSILVDLFPAKIESYSRFITRTPYRESLEVDSWG